MQRVVTDSHIEYTGHQLRSLWIYDTFGIAGDAIAAFAGPCNVSTDALVDNEDRHAGSIIRAALMLHLIIEHFDDDLLLAVFRQRLLIAIIKDLVQETSNLRDLVRHGDDIFCTGKKLTVSIATISPVSTLIHTGINIDPSGAPVAAAGLRDFGIDHLDLADRLTAAYIAEIDSAAHARAKVRGVT
jgi:uncharacterized protein